MGRFHHSKKAHSEGTRWKKTQSAGQETKKHKNIWNSFAIFWRKIRRLRSEQDPERRRDRQIKIPPAIPPPLEFIPLNVGDVEADEDKRARI